MKVYYSNTDKENLIPIQVQGKNYMKVLAELKGAKKVVFPDDAVFVKRGSDQHLSYKDGVYKMLEQLNP